MVSSSYNALKIKALKLLEEFKDAVAMLPKELSSNISDETLESKVKLVRDGKFKLMVVGEAKSGKSTFINAYLGTDLLPMDVQQCTSAIIEIKYAPQIKLTVNYANGEWAVVRKETEIRKFLQENAAMQSEYRKIPVAFLNQLIVQRQGKKVPSISEVCEQLKNDNIYQLSDEEYQQAIGQYLDEWTQKWEQIVTHIVIEYPLPEKMHDVHIIDSPGVNALGKVGEQTENFIDQANAVVFLKPLNGQAIESKSFTEFINSKNGNRHKKSLFLLLTHAAEMKDVDISRLRGQAVEMYHRYLKDDMIIPIDSMVQLYLNRFETMTESEFSQLIFDEVQNGLVGAGSWTHMTWSYFKDDFKQRATDKAKFDTVQEKFEEYARSAQWIALSELIKCLVKCEKQILGKLHHEVDLKNDQISCSEEELCQKINEITDKLNDLKDQLEGTIDSIEDQYIGLHGKLLGKKKALIEEVKGKLQNTDFAKLETDITAITDPLRSYPSVIHKELVDECNQKLAVKLGDNDLACFWADILEPDVDATSIQLLKQKIQDEDAKNVDGEGSIYYTYTTGTTFTESHRGLNNDRFASKVKQSIENRLDDIATEMHKQIQTMVTNIICQYKTGLEKRINDETSHLADKKTEKKAAEELRTDIEHLSAEISKNDSRKIELERLEKEVSNGINGN